MKKNNKTTTTATQTAPTAQAVKPDQFVVRTNKLVRIFAKNPNGPKILGDALALILFGTSNMLVKFVRDDGKIIGMEASEKFASMQAELAAKSSKKAERAAKSAERKEKAAARKAARIERMKARAAKLAEQLEKLNAIEVTAPAPEAAPAPESK